MNEEMEEELSPDERRALGALAGEKEPPALLEERVVKVLKESNLIRPSRAGWWPAAGWARVAAAFAAALVLFTAGLLVGTRRASAPARQAGMSEFLLILRAPAPHLQATTSEAVLQRVREYEAWSGEVRREGLMLEGEKLKEEARTLHGADGRPAVSVSRDGPTEEEGSVAGFFLIRARDYEHAVTIAEGCPHLKYGGSIEVRQIEHL
jgi:hypothetical protein